MTIQTMDEKEAAYLYDLVLAPQWRERFDALADDTLKLPARGGLLEIGSGTGAYAIDLAVRGGHDVSVLGLESNAAMRVIAQGKAEMQRVHRVAFQAGELTATGLNDAAFAWVLADASLALVLAPKTMLADVWQEMARVAAKDATVALKLTTYGSFDEFFSVYWEALYELDWLAHTAALESLITARPTLSEVEALAKQAKLKNIQSATRKEIFTFADGQSFLNDPLMSRWFLSAWLAPWTKAAQRQRLEAKLIELIDRARDDMNFEVSIKATLVTAQK